MLNTLSTIIFTALFAVNSMLITADNAVQRIVQKLNISNKTYVVVDFTKHSKQKRLYVYKGGRLVYSTYVAHGEKSGGLYARNFSNTVNSHKSSIGVFKIDKKPYTGKYGRSIRISGLEKGINDNARKRYIVIHPSHYVKHDGSYVGRSWGCFTISYQARNDLLKMIEGAYLIAYYPDKQWLNKSVYLN